MRQIQREGQCWSASTLKEIGPYSQKSASFRRKNHFFPQKNNGTSSRRRINKLPLGVLAHFLPCRWIISALAGTGSESVEKMDSGQFREFAKAAVDYIANYIDDVENRYVDD